jgi:hypothetical protein
MAAAEISTFTFTFPFGIEIYDSISISARDLLRASRPGKAFILVAVAWTPNAKNSTSRGVACYLVAGSRGSNLQILN